MIERSGTLCLCSSMRTIVLLAAFAVASLAEAQGPGPRGGRPVILHIEGRLQDSAQAARPDGKVTSLGFLGHSGPKNDTRFVGVTTAKTVGGDPGILGKDVLEQLAPTVPNLLLTGPPGLVDRVRHAKPGTPIVLEGLVNRSDRTYLLRTAHVGTR